MRYFADARRRAVAVQIGAEVLRAAEAQGPGGWITYLIRDPRQPDRRGNPAGTPIYIGQTKEFAKRVLKRFMTSEKLAPRHDSIERRVADLLHRDVVVRYEILERVAEPPNTLGATCKVLHGHDCSCCGSGKWAAIIQVR